MTERDASSDAQPRPARRFRLILAGVFFGTVAALVLAEIGLRLFGWRPGVNIIYGENYRLSSNPVLKYELVPNAPDWGMRINSAGMRDREFSKPKPPGVFRIAALGDSVTYGFGYKQTQAYPKQLEKMLNEQFGDRMRFEVMNLGVVGYNIEQIVEAARVKALPFQPDLLLYGYVLNDPLTFSVELEALRRMQAEAERTWRETFSRGLMRMLSHSRLFLLGYQLTLRPPTPPGENETDPVVDAFFRRGHTDYIRRIHHEPKTWGRVTGGLRRLAEVARTGDAKTLVVVFPPSFIETEPEYSLRDVHERIMEEAQRNGLSAGDLAPVFVQARRAWRYTLFRDLLHPDAVGHRVAAMGIVRILLDRHLLPVGDVRFDDLHWSDPFEEHLARFLRRGTETDPQPP
ncbi:MAG: SGNH/GDSL hydrolase family protein [Planctomycetota bacterium]|nr:MAG: SGNH/GDSL hydrolase family protein [Planctomycetota bacterium]